MERLRQKDKEASIEERLANDRDRKIAEIRREESLYARRPLPVFRDLVRVTSKPQVAKI